MYIVHIYKFIAHCQNKDESYFIFQDVCVRYMQALQKSCIERNSTLQYQSWIEKS